MARIGSKRQVAIDIMNSNAKKSMADVIAMIATANDLAPGAARSYYTYLVKEGMAKGKIEESVRAPKASKEKTVKRMAKEVAAKVVKAVKPTAPTKSPEEIEKIKAANMARMKAVLGKVKQTVVKDEEVPTFAETDSFAAPAFLTKDEVEALV
jgi:site-specific recombinase XerC